ncbi:MAG: bacterial transcriptional activator domain-containing protein [Lachnospiraceae bacterium]|nr:bacterial transcriptional activator domain-containing protein [Lachnospiraceae bacterium]
MDELKITLLGGFSLYYQGREITLGRGSASKFQQLLQLVWIVGDRGIQRDEIVRDLYNPEELSNPGNSFNNLLFQMRKQMAAAGLPKKAYIVRQGKLFVPDPQVPVRVDVQDFCTYCRQAEETTDGKKRENFRKAFALYKGELLPESATLTWVVVASAHLRSLFQKCTDWLGQDAKMRKDYSEMAEIYRRAAEIYPDDDWQAEEIEALILMDRYKEANDLYNTTVHRYADEMGVHPTDKMLENYQKMSEKIVQPVSDLHEIQSNLSEKQEGGGYYCSYPGFIDLYHVLRRNMERTGISIYLMLCTLVDYEGKIIRNRDKLEARSAVLRKVIGERLRKGDIYTRYNSSQYLLLLPGANKEDCSAIAAGIQEGMKQSEGTKAEVRFSEASVAAELPRREG